MVRPQASRTNKDLVLLFADLTTIPTENHMDWIARTGPVSVFAAFTQCCASCVRVHKQGPSDGITELESNKVLEDAAGFRRVRSRRAKPIVLPELGGTQSDGPGYYFSNRRWRNPNDPADMTRMRERWEVVLQNHRHVAIGCTFERMLEVVQRCRNLWAIKNPISNKSRHRPSTQAHLVGSKRSRDSDSMDGGDGAWDGEEGFDEGEEAAARSALEQLSDLAAQTVMQEHEHEEHEGHEEREEAAVRRRQSETVAAAEDGKEEEELRAAVVLTQQSGTDRKSVV